MTRELQLCLLLSWVCVCGGSVVQTSHGGLHGGETPGGDLADPSVMPEFGLQERHDVLEGVGWWDAQVHIGFIR